LCRCRYFCCRPFQALLSLPVNDLDRPSHHLSEAEQEARMTRHFAAADARQIVQLATQTATHEEHPIFHEPEENGSQWMALHG
jgi:hypothetical protein